MPSVTMHVRPLWPLQLFFISLCTWRVSAQAHVVQLAKARFEIICDGPEASSETYNSCRPNSPTDTLYERDAQALIGQELTLRDLTDEKGVTIFGELTTLTLQNPLQNPQTEYAGEFRFVLLPEMGCRDADGMLQFTKLLQRADWIGPFMELPIVAEFRDLSAMQMASRTSYGTYTNFKRTNTIYVSTTAKILDDEFDIGPFRHTKDMINGAILAVLETPQGGSLRGNIAACATIRADYQQIEFTQFTGLGASIIFLALILINIIFCLPVGMTGMTRSLDVIRPMSAFSAGLLIGDVFFRQLQIAYGAFRLNPEYAGIVGCATIILISTIHLIFHFPPKVRLGGGLYGPDFRTIEQRHLITMETLSNHLESVQAKIQATASEDEDDGIFISNRTEEKNNPYKFYEERIKTMRTQEIKKAKIFHDEMMQPTNYADRYPGVPDNQNIVYADPAEFGFYDLMRREHRVDKEARALLNRPSAGYACTICSISMVILRKFEDGALILDGFRHCAPPEINIAIPTEQENNAWLVWLNVLAHALPLEIVYFFVLVCFGKFSMCGAFFIQIFMAFFVFAGALYSILDEIHDDGRGVIFTISSTLTIYLSLVYLLPNQLTIVNRAHQLISIGLFLFGSIIAGLPLVQTSYECMRQHNFHLNYRS